MKLLLFFVLSLQTCLCTDFYMYHCKYIASKTLVQKLSTFKIKGKFIPSNHSTIIYFGSKYGFNTFKDFASKFDIKPIMISGQIKINTNHLNSNKKLFEYSNQQGSQSQSSSFTGLSGTNIKIQLGQETVKQFQDLYQISNTGLYLNLIPIKIGDHFEVELSIRSTTLNEKTLFSSQTILVHEGSWTSLSNFQDVSRSNTKNFTGQLKDLVQKQNKQLSLNAQILIQSQL
jgi:hypothetical protein